MKNIEKKTGSGKFNLKCLIPFRDMECKEFGSSEIAINGLVTSICLSLGITYAIFAFGYKEFYPLKYGEALRNEILQNERNGFHYDLNADLSEDTVRYEDFCNKKE